MKTARPVYLSLTRFAWPLTAIASIIHRVTGVLLVAGVAYLLWLVSMALQSPAGFASAQSVLAEPIAKLLLVAVVAALLYHLFAGIKHIVMDFHLGDSFAAAKANSIVVFVLTAVSTAAVGVWLW
jgi:succinate dehydrogenase / fumarate reductase cytochrome b subunit